MGVGKRGVPVGSTVAVSIVPPATRVPPARRRARPSDQATISAPAVRPSQQSTIAVPVVSASLEVESRDVAPRRTVLAMTQRAPALGMELIEEIPIDLGDLEDDPAMVTEAQARLVTQPHRVAIGDRMLEGRRGPPIWLLAMTVAGLAIAATLLAVV